MYHDSASASKFYPTFGMLPSARCQRLVRNSCDPLVGGVSTDGLHPPLPPLPSTQMDDPSEVTINAEEDELILQDTCYVKV